MMLWESMTLLMVVLGFGGVAFITLLERKVLGLTQSRLGPTKSTLWGVLQPMADGIKLLTKDFQNVSSILVLLSGPLLMLVLFKLTWLVTPWMGKCNYTSVSGPVFILLMSIIAYSVIISSWVSYSSFAKLGMARSILQSLAYEVTFVATFFILFIINSSPSLSSGSTIPLIFCWSIWVILLMLDCNRAPFDLLEGESELISGFNTEMSSLSFVFLFLGEYGMILVFCVLMVNVFEVSIIMGLASLVTVLLSRSSFPRLRYDSLMLCLWMSMLPMVLLLMVVSYFML